MRKVEEKAREMVVVWDEQWRPHCPRCGRFLHRAFWGLEPISINGIDYYYCSHCGRIWPEK